MKNNEFCHRNVCQAAKSAEWWTDLRYLIKINFAILILKEQASAFKF